MATEVGSAFVSIVPSARGFGNSLGKSIGGGVTTEGKRQGRIFGSTFARTSVGPIRAGFGAISRSVAGIVGPLAAIGGIRVLSGFVDDARESARISALTTQAIKSTGGAANVTAKQVSRLSTAISNKTGVDDEAIQSGANLLLTFTNVRNEVGKGNKIFSRANQTITDMSAALGQDTKSSAIQLGKALNDPVKGITALSRVGVSFTEQQKTQIKTMVESGNRLGAQKVILGELSKEFGGAAAAMATPADRLKVTLGNLGEAIGAQLIPFIDRFAVFMVNRGIPALVQFGGFLKANVLPVIKRFAGFLGSSVLPPLIGFAKAAFSLGRTLRGDFISGLQGARDNMGGLRGFMQKTGELTLRFGIFLKTKVIPALQQFAAWVGPKISTGVAILGTFLAQKVIPALIAFGGFLSGTVVPALQRFGAFVQTSVIPAVQRMAILFQTRILPVLRQVGAFLITQLGPAFRSFSTFVMTSVLPALQGLWARLQAVAPTFGRLALIVGKIVVVLAAVAIVIIGKVLPPLFKFAGFLITVLFAAVGKVIGIVAGFIRVVIRIGTVVGQMATIVSGHIAAVIGFFVTLHNKVVGAVGNFGTLLVEAGKDLIRGLVTGIKSLATAPVDAVKGVGKGIVSGFKGLVGIGSPSKVFAGFGVNINEGLVLGMKRSNGLLNTGARHQAETLTGAFRAPTLARSADVRRPGGGGGDTIIVHNPKPEPASESVEKAIQRKKHRAGWAAA